MQPMADDEEIDTIELSFDTDLMTAESIQTGCSDTRATQKTSVEFFGFQRLELRDAYGRWGGVYLLNGLCSLS